MSWFTEDAWPPMLFCLVVGGLCLAAGLTGRGEKWLWAGLALLALCPVLWVVEWKIVTDAEVVEGRVHDLGAAFVANDEATFLEFFDPKHLVLRGQALLAIRTVDVPDLAIREVAVTDAGTAAVGRSYQTLFRANGTVHSAGMQSHVATRWKLVWQLRDGRWTIVAVTRMHPVRDEELELFSAER
jgi:hypothetical protein